MVLCSVCLVLCVCAAQPQHGTNSECDAATTMGSKDSDSDAEKESVGAYILVCMISVSAAAIDGGLDGFSSLLSVSRNRKTTRKQGRRREEGREKEIQQYYNNCTSTVLFVSLSKSFPVSLGVNFLLAGVAPSTQSEEDSRNRA